MAEVDEIATDICIVPRQHYTFEDIYNYIGSKRYPDKMKDKGQKANFRRAVKPFAVNNGKLTYLKKAKDGSLTEVCKTLILLFFLNIDLIIFIISIQLLFGSIRTTALSLGPAFPTHSGLYVDIFITSYCYCMIVC